MNLKESFRYQNFLDSDAEDMVEEVDYGEFHKNDDVLGFMLRLVEEKERLTTAIGIAKASIGFDIDTAVETNKFRQAVASRVKTMLRFMPSKKTERGMDYKFNVEGNQTQYYYDIEVVTEEAFDRDKAKTASRNLISEADSVSAAIDSAMINTKVDYEPPFNVNDSFEDVMEEFLSKQ